MKFIYRYSSNIFQMFKHKPKLDLYYHCHCKGSEIKNFPLKSTLCQGRSRGASEFLLKI